MTAVWTPSPGQVVLVEPQEAAECGCLTGLVLSSDGATVAIDLGASCPREADHLRVLASFYAADALYRVQGELHPSPDRTTVVELEAWAVERIQRRSTARVRVDLPASLSAFDDGDCSSVAGRTIDLGPGGCRVATKSPFPREVDPTVTIRFPNGDWAIALARILESQQRGSVWEYRMVFADLDDDESDRISRLANVAAAVQRR